MVGRLRIDVADGRYHVALRGIERHPILLDKPYNSSVPAEIGESAGGMDYKAVSAQGRRLRADLKTDRALSRVEKACLEQLAIVET